MNDEVLTIRVTESEINLITLLLEQAGTMEDENGQPAFELLHDIMEQTARQDDWDLEPTDLDGRTFSVSENDFIDHGIRAREMQKHTSMAANRRTMRFTRSDTDETTESSDIKNHDLWERPNDPIKW